ncbi:MAG: hypothetical protein AABX61_02920 [Nanoarchaeota archaeon]
MECYRKGIYLRGIESIDRTKLKKIIKENEDYLSENGICLGEANILNFEIRHSVYDGWMYLVEGQFVEIISQFGCSDDVRRFGCMDDVQITIKSNKKEGINNLIERLEKNTTIKEFYDEKTQWK